VLSRTFGETKRVLAMDVETTEVIVNYKNRNISHTAKIGEVLYWQGKPDIEESPYNLLYNNIALLI
jgi:hypothetical protein